MRILLRFGLMAVAAMLNGFAVRAAPPETRAPVTILVSIDGFRADYLDRGITPNLSALAAGGLSAAMRPVFPSKTAPNHWSMVTGVLPDRHGIVSNEMEDSARPGERFTMQSTDPFWWNAAPPIWVEAEQAGIRTADLFWPGAHVAWGGAVGADQFKTVQGATRPRDWFPFSYAVSARQRVDVVIDWLRRPAPDRPHFVTLYFDTIDTVGHNEGPDAPETNAAISALDAQFGRLMAGLSAIGQPANLVIVSDHGMAQTGSARIVPLADLAAPGDYRAVETGAYAGLVALPGREEALAAALLRPHPHVQCWRKGEIPPRFRYGANPRIPPFFCLADVGWKIVAKPPEKAETGGDHGYDNQAPEMRALFIANGPAFSRPTRLATFDNLDIYPLLRTLLGLPRKPGLDGDDAPFRGLVSPLERHAKSGNRDGEQAN